MTTLRFPRCAPRGGGETGEGLRLGMCRGGDRVLGRKEITAERNSSSEWPLSLLPDQTVKSRKYY